MGKLALNGLVYVVLIKRQPKLAESTWFMFGGVLMVLCRASGFTIKVRKD